MVLRPAEIAVIILTFSEYAIQPFQNALGLAAMTETDRSNIIKLVSLLALGEMTLIGVKAD
jgi:solute carrier family 7 (L-type amino acid transporter), member 9/15